MARKKATAKNKGVGGGAVGSRGRVAAKPSNGPQGMTDDEVRDWTGKLDRAHAKAQKAAEEAKSLNGEYRDMLKSAKKQGLDKDAYIEARDLDREDHGQVQVRLANVGRYLRVRGSNLATQMDLFQIEMPVIDDEPAAVKGLKAGRSGMVNQDANPFAPGTEDYQAWANNWTQGQAELAQESAGASQH